MTISTIRGCFAVFAAMAVLAMVALGFSSPAFAQSNLVYVESNIGCTSNMNSILAFSNDGAGNLTPIAGSPFLTMGTGWCDPLLATSSVDTDFPIVIDPTGSFLFAVNANSNTVSEFSIAPGGALTLMTNPPISSGGIEPESLALSPAALHNGYSVLSIANKDHDPNQPFGVPSIRTMTVDPSGTMRKVQNGNIPFAAGDYLGSVNTNSIAPGLMFANQLFGGDVSNIYSYKVGPLGIMQQTGVIGPPAPGEQELGIAFHPVHHVMYMGVPSNNEVAVYTYDHNGVLTLVNTVANTGETVCWFAINAAGDRLYSVESKSGSVSVYSTANATSPVELQHFKVANQPQNVTQAAIDPTGNFLYVIGTTNANGNGLPYLHVFSIDQSNGQTRGKLTELTPVLLDVPAGEHPQGVSTLVK